MSEEIREEEIWNLDVHISQFILPRLKKFREDADKDFFGYPSELHERFGERMAAAVWKNYIDDMIYAFEVGANENHFDPSIDWARVRRGLEKFGTYFFSLWT